MYQVLIVTEFPDRKAAAEYAKEMVEEGSYEVDYGGHIIATAVLDPLSNDAFTAMAREVIANVIGTVGE